MTTDEYDKYPRLARIIRDMTEFSRNDPVDWSLLLAEINNALIEAKEPKGAVIDLENKEWMPWCDWTPEQRSEFKKAVKEGGVVEYLEFDRGFWVGDPDFDPSDFDVLAYRIKPEAPKRAPIGEDEPVIDLAKFSDRTLGGFKVHGLSIGKSGTQDRIYGYVDHEMDYSKRQNLSWDADGKWLGSSSIHDYDLTLRAELPQAETMELRNAFAMVAMGHTMASNFLIDLISEPKVDLPSSIAKFSFEVADAMLEARKGRMNFDYPDGIDAYNKWVDERDKTRYGASNEAGE